ncbi:MAG: histidine kinase [Muribaculaceae bacterium]|nr:histidine kinase [Muribaculaceae bacterium]
MSIFSKQTKQETIIYTIVWVVLFLSPLVSLLFSHEDTANDPSWIWHSLLDTWVVLLTFFVVFLIHNHVLAPMLVKHKRTKLYIVACVLMVTVFQLAQCAHKPNGQPLMSVAEKEMPPPPPPPNGHPPIDKHDLSVFIIIVLMIGANLGVKYYFQNEEEKKHLAKLREQSLKQELDYLRYQINPHFIMNTLNNIHALVDIDPEQAKDSIVDMSRMMRYLLYESDKQYVSLSKAIEFLKKYLNLMQLRYSDNVTINLDVPEECSDPVVLAPLVFIPFVENAFKHGVSYDKPSTIDIDIERKGHRLLFHCCNTKSGTKHEYGGVGLNNVTKRLELIYGTDYSLDIKDEETTYDVTLDLPERHPEDFDGAKDQAITDKSYD